MASRNLRSKPGWQIGVGEADRDDVRALLTYHFDRMRAASPPEACHVMEAERLADPAIRLLTLREGGTLLGVGAWKRLDDPAHGEIKSMRTAPVALGRGVGRALLRALVADAAGHGIHRLSLETGSTAPFAAALRLYASEGFEPCGPFGCYTQSAFTRFFERRL